MERSKKSRSLGTDPNPSKQPTSTTTATAKRPELGDRQCSATITSSRRHSDAKRISEGSRVSGRTRRSSKASSRDDQSRSSTTGDFQFSDRHRSSSFSVSSSTKSTDKDELPVLTFAVIGNPKVGKSVFIRNALDLRRPSHTAVSTSRVSLSGVQYRLQLLETPRDSVNFIHDRIIWPYVPEAGGSPHIDGVLCLYDVSNKESLEGLPEILAALGTTEVVTCLVSCKVDVPQCDYEIPGTFPEKVKSEFPAFIVEKARIDSSDTAKRCLLKVLKASLAEGGVRSQLPSRPPSDQNVPTVFPPRTSSRNPSQSSSRSGSMTRPHPMHSRSRDNLLSYPPPPVIESESGEDIDLSSADEAVQRSQPVKKPLQVKTTNATPKRSAGHPQTPESPSTRAKVNTATHAVPETPESFFESAMLRRGSADSRNFRTFLDMDDESIHETGEPVDGITEKMQDMNATEDSNPGEGLTFSELVDKLLATPSSKGDQKFEPAFLCLYRAFATPLALLKAIIQRIAKTGSSNMVAFAKTAEVLRYLSILGTWTTYYPGDFADPIVREMATKFISGMGESKNYAAAARQVSNNLQTIVPDDDDDWAYGSNPQPIRHRSNTGPAKLMTSFAPVKDTKPYPKTNPRPTDEDDSDNDDNGPTPSSPHHSVTTSSASSLVKATQVSSQTSDNLHNLEASRESARKLRTVPHNPATKIQWHQLMSYSAEELATEITRVDWIMYSAIRPRDFVRYVTVPSSQRVRSGQIDHIGMMTRHFNHLALFVSGMILLRDKPKHRAQMLEKFMSLAWKVRQLNNYHALGAIVAALNSEEIVRLSQTQDLVPQEQHKQFLRLKILMGHQKSHAAYRMAWENSSAEKIPFLPRIQEDLTKAATGNPTFVGNRIKWSKFEVMGETIVGVQRSQQRPYVFPDRTARGHEIAKLILETKVLDSEEDSADPQQELYERSKQVEPVTSGTDRKKFDWLRR